jgi:hypothetical protein
MTKADFLMWLDGYLSGCGDKPNMAVIAEKLALVAPPVQPGPYLPFAPQPYDPLYPAPRSIPETPIWSPYTTCNGPGIPAVARALADGMRPLGADFGAVWDDNVDNLYQN